jgi:undecaprenyl diphosphate synthase
MEITKVNQRLVLNIAFNYGGRDEIMRAIRRILADQVPASQIDEACVSRSLDTNGQPDPELIVRTAGELRLSNFLLWQSANAEFYATEAYWPDFDERELERALAYFQTCRARA